MDDVMKKSGKDRKKKGKDLVILYLRHYIELTVTEVISKKERKKCFRGKKKEKKYKEFFDSNLL
jgi:hypothetical protein